MTAHVKPSAYYYPRTALVVLENTHNRAGGRVWPQAQASAVADAARGRGIAIHLDGARLWNAAVATGLSARELAAPFDTVSVCFSKGLGAPVGSALVGPRRLIDKARRLRKRWGGGMRQVGILAEGARYALEHHLVRLSDDHAHAKLLAETLSRAAGIVIDLPSVETNIVNIDLAPPLLAEDVARVAYDLGVRVNASGPRRLRAVTHLEVSRADILRAAARIEEAVARAVSAAPRL
jgi:threonine aldolase